MLPLPVAAFTSAIQDGCPDLQVEFLDLSQDATQWEWTFTGGEPTTSNEQNPTVTYPNSGTFPVTLKVTNETGQNMLTEQDYIFIRELPTANFSLELVGNRINLTNLSVNADSYFWSFGDSFTSMRENPSHDYFEDGFYVVQLIAENGGCQPDTFSQSIVIEQNAVVAVFGVDNPQGCPGLEVNFLNESVNAARIEWLFPGGNPATSDLTNPVVNYDSSGIFPVSLIAVNGLERDTFTQENAVEVLDAAVADFTYSVDRFTITFDNLSRFGETYFWVFGDGTTSVEANPVHTFAPDQEYIVRLTVSNSICAANTFERLVSFAPPPIPRFRKVGDNGCPPLRVEFYDESENATDWEWTFPGGTPATSTEQNPVILYREPGSFSVTLDAGNASGSNAFTFANSVKVDTGAVADFVFVENGATVEFTNESTYGVAYEWDFGDGETSGELDPQHTFPDNGEFTVQLAAFNFNCGWDTIVKSVTINALPIADFEFIEPTDCSVSGVTFMDASRYSPVSYRWTFSGGNPFRSDEANPTITYSSSGTYEATLIVENEAGRDTISKEITIQTDEYRDRTYAFCENETFTLNGETYDSGDRFAAQTLTGQNGACDTTLFLNFDILPTYKLSQEVTIFQGESYLFGDEILTVGGKYTATLQTVAGCDSTVTLDLTVRPRNEGLMTVDGGRRTVDGSAKVSDLNDDKAQVGNIAPASRNVALAGSLANNELLAFPNPFTKSTDLSFHLTQSTPVSLTVFNNLGQVIALLKNEETLAAGEQQIRWQPADNLPKGVYWVQLQMGDLKKWQRVVWQ
ncbi:MAG: PKD domain-containing protein, partial [Saprospiraceae bacterium]